MPPKLQVGNLYTTKDYIFTVVDYDYDHHKGHTEYLIKTIVPSTFKTTYDLDSSTMWIRLNIFPTYEELPKDHPAWILFGKK